MLRRFQAMPLNYPSLVQPRSRYFLARSLERLGDLEGAREAIRPLIRLWTRAEADRPLVAEARALAARLDVH